MRGGRCREKRGLEWRAGSTDRGDDDDEEEEEIRRRPDRLLSLRKPLTTPRQVLRQRRGGQRRVRRADVPQRRLAVARMMMRLEEKNKRWRRWGSNREKLACDATGGLLLVKLPGYH